MVAHNKYTDTIRIFTVYSMGVAGTKATRDFPSINAAVIPHHDPLPGASSSAEPQWYLAVICRLVIELVKLDYIFSLRKGWVRRRADSSVTRRDSVKP